MSIISPCIQSPLLLFLKETPSQCPDREIRLSARRVRNEFRDLKDTGNFMIPV